MAEETKGLDLPSSFEELFDVDLHNGVLWFPHWMLIALFATLAPAPWIKWRFRLRTLLIVTALVALFFGARRIVLTPWAPPR